MTEEERELLFQGYTDLNRIIPANDIGQLTRIIRQAFSAGFLFAQTGLQPEAKVLFDTLRLVDRNIEDSVVMFVRENSIAKKGSI